MRSPDSKIVQKHGTKWTYIILYKTSLYGEALRIFFQDFLNPFKL
jgi:hypothetical protein